MGARRAWLLVATLLLAGCSDEEPEAAPATSTTSSTTTIAALAELPVPRTEVAGAVLQGQIVVAGGVLRPRIVVVGGLTPDGAASNRVDLYDPAANRWDPGPPLPLGLHHSGMAASGDRVYVAGGYTNGAGQDWVAQSRVFSMSGDGAWREEPPLSAPRGGLAMAAVAGRLVAVGGTDSRGQLLRRTEVFTPGERAWTPGPDMAQARDHLAVAASGGRIYAIAGRLGSLESNMSSVESWDPAAAGGWRTEPGLNETRGGTSAAEAGGRPCVAGGEEPTGTIASIECLGGGRWARVAMLRSPRHGLAVVGLGDRLHVIAGGPQPGLFVSGTHEAFTIP